MTILLDTHVFLWWLDNPQQLSAAGAAAIADPDNEVFVSVATLWEIALKRTIGKLQAAVNLEADVERVGFTLLPITPRHIGATEALPLHHRDPFDRLLIAQAQCEGATLATRDQHFTSYKVPLILA